MKQPFPSVSRNKVLPILILALLVVATGVSLLFYGQSDAIKPAKSGVAGTVQTQFSFNGAIGWHKGPVNDTSMVVFADDRSCFAMMYYKTGTLDVAAKLQKQHDDLAATGAAMTSLADTTATATINATLRQYALHQYSITSGSEKLLGGLQLGYVQLQKGYLEIQGHCNTAEQLPTTIPPLESFGFKQF